MRGKANGKAPGGAVAQDKWLKPAHGNTNRYITLGFPESTGSTIWFVAVDPGTSIQFVPMPTLQSFVCATSRQPW